MDKIAFDTFTRVECFKNNVNFHTLNRLKSHIFHEEMRHEGNKYSVLRRTIRGILMAAINTAF